MAARSELGKAHGPRPLADLIAIAPWMPVAAVALLLAGRPLRAERREELDGTGGAADMAPRR